MVVKLEYNKELISEFSIFEDNIKESVHKMIEMENYDREQN